MDYRADSEQRYSGKGGAIAEDDLRAALDKLGIGVPDAANFVTVDEGAGRYAFRAECVVVDDMLTNGELACRVTEEGILYQEDNFLSVSTLCGNAMVFAPSIGEKCFVEKREQKQERTAPHLLDSMLYCLTSGVQFKNSCSFLIFIYFNCYLFKFLSIHPCICLSILK